MKKLLTTFVVIFTTSVLGIGVFRAAIPVNQPNKTQFSLFVIEPISTFSSLYYQQWTGYTVGDTFYTQHNLLTPITESLDIGAGIDNTYDFKTQLNSTGINAVIQYKAW